MKRFFIIPAVVLFMCLSFCANRRKDAPSYSQTEINLSARCIMAREALDRRLDALEAQTKDTAKRRVVPLRFSHDSFNVE